MESLTSTLPFWSSSILVIFEFGRLPFWSSSILVSLIFTSNHQPPIPIFHGSERVEHNCYCTSTPWDTGYWVLVIRYITVAQGWILVAHHTQQGGEGRDTHLHILTDTCCSNNFLPTLVLHCPDQKVQVSVVVTDDLPYQRLLKNQSS